MWNNILSIGKNLRQGLQVGAKAVTNELKYGAKVIKNEVDYTFNNKTDPIGKRPKEALANTVGQITQGLAKEFPVETEALTMATQAVSPIIKSVTDQAEWEAEQGNISPMATLGHGIRTIRGTGNAGAHLAHHTGVDQDIGRFIGEGVADSVLTAGVGKASKALRQSTPLTIGGGPKPALAGATSGSGRNFVSINPGAKPNLSPQVMEARYLSQPDFDIKQPQRIRDARDLVDSSGLKIQNIEEANPGVTTKELSIKNPEYKAAKKVHKTKTAQVSSEESNILTPGPGREYAYPPTRPRAKEIKVASLEARKTIEDLELHHKLPKGISAAFFNRARDFMENGVMTLDEFKDMAVRAQKRGMEPGDIEQNILPQSKVPHNRFHTEMRAQPSNQFPGENLEISKTKLTERLRQVKNKKDLNKLWDEFLDDDGRYLYESAEIWEAMDEVIKSISPEYTGTAKSKKK